MRTGPEVGAATPAQPCAHPAAITIPSPQEKGQKLTIRGVVYAPDGKTPIRGATIVAYHTDAGGYYHRGARNHPSMARLLGTLCSDAAGRFEVRTIRPGAYPDADIAPHVHWKVSAPGYGEQSFELQFRGDPHVDPRMARESEGLGRFGSVQPLARDAAGALSVEYDMRLRR